MQDIAILLLAAGQSSRMGGIDKLMQKIEGQPLLTRSCERALSTGMPCYVTLPDLSHPRAAACAQAIPVAVADAAEGMGASIRAGVAALPAHCEAVMILPCDMPDLETGDLLQLASAFDAKSGQVLRASTPEGIPGHPVLFPRSLFAQLAQLHGDQGARSLLKTSNLRLVPLPDQRAVTDLDTPAAWADWRARTGRTG